MMLEHCACAASCRWCMCNVTTSIFISVSIGEQRRRFAVDEFGFTENRPCRDCSTGFCKCLCLKLFKGRLAAWSPLTTSL